MNKNDKIIQDSNELLHDNDELIQKNDVLLRHIAGEYIKHYGELLTEEQKKLEIDNITYPSSNMERRVKKAAARKKYVQYISAVAGLAACLAIVLLVRFVPQNVTNSSPSDIANRPGAHTSDPSVQAGSNLPQEHNSGSLPQDNTNQSDAHTSDLTPHEDSSQPSAPNYSVIPLSFVPSDGFTQKEFIQDREKSVYSFEDSFGDDVVMTLEHAARVPDAESLARLNIGGTIMYAEVAEGYNLLTFVSDGVLHELTCRYDINTLTRFVGAIV